MVAIVRPVRPARRDAAKIDRLDATRAASEARARVHLAAPRDRHKREAIRTLLRTRQRAAHVRTQAIHHLKALVAAAAELLRARLRALSSNARVDRCARLRSAETRSVEAHATRPAPRASARRILALSSEIRAFGAEPEPLVQTAAPTLRAGPGVGSVTRAEMLCAWSHRGWRVDACRFETSARAVIRRAA